jgi:hypothetical protein
MMRLSLEFSAGFMLVIIHFCLLLILACRLKHFKGSKRHKFYL